MTELVSKTWRRFEPPPALKVSEWASTHRRLSPESSAEAGAFDMNRTPYFREIVDCYNDPLIEETIVIKSSQVAYTENLNNLLGYIVDIRPGPVMVMQPTLEMAESFSKDRISPMIRDTPRLTKLVDDRSRTSGNTILHKVFPGGLLQMVGANSPASLASRPMRDLLGDEPDRYPASAGKEGDPWKIASKRQITFFDRKRFLGGTPTLKGASRIEKAFERGDKRQYLMPCPLCQGHVPFERHRFDHDPASPTYAQFQCPDCDGWIEEHERFDMLRDEVAGGSAFWSPTVETDGRIRSYRLWSAHSPFIGWREMFDEYNEAKGDPEMEQVVFNTLFGESYQFANVELDHDHLFRGREDYDGQSLPPEVEIITSGIDTQDDRFEISVIGWGAGEESWSIEYFTIEGDPEEKATRDKLDKFLTSSVYERTDGRSLRIAAAFVDLGGHRTDAVYKFARGKAFRHVFASKGVNAAGQAIFVKFSQQKKEKVRIALIGTDTAKEVIYARLAKGGETVARCHFPQSYSEAYFKGLVSEEKVVKWRSGTPLVKWQKRKGEAAARNEPLDCFVYALAALRSLPMALRRLRRKEAVAARAAKRAAAAEVEAPPEEEPEPVEPEAPAALPQRRPAARPRVRERPPRRRGGWSL